MDIPNLYRSYNLDTSQSRFTKSILRQELNLENISTILYIEFSDCDFFLQEFVPNLPPSVTKIVGTDTDMKKVAIAASRCIKDHVKFKQMNLLSEFLDVSEKYDCILSFWDLRWTHNMDVAFKNVRNLLNPNGFGLFIIETNNQFYSKVVSKIMSTWKDYNNYLPELLRGMPPFVDEKDAIEKVSVALSEAGLTKEKCYSKIDTIVFRGSNSVEEMQDVLHRSYSVSKVLPPSLHRKFYDRVADVMTPIPVKTNGGADENHYVLKNTILVTTFKNLNPAQTQESP